MSKNLKHLLQKNTAFHVLFILNILAILGIFYVSIQTEFPDGNSYWYMAKSIGHGTFSSWYFLPVHTPETLRTWGYPFFVYLCQLIHDAPITVKIVQLFLHFGTLLLLLRLIYHFNKELLYRNLFLLLLLPNLQIAYYTGQVASETISIFFIVLFFYGWFVWQDRWIKHILLGIIAFAIYQLKPVFIAFPFVLVLYKILFDRKNLKYHLLFFSLFSLSLLPFGFWNKKQHGIFKITPLEGGGGAANLGFWAFRLPAGYSPRFYWEPSIGSDFTQPDFTTEEKKKEYVKVYEEEWSQVNQQLEKYITPEDSVRRAFMIQKKYKLFEVWSGTYTNAREQLLKKQLIADIRSSPAYYIKTRLYTLVRMWFTGINPDELKKASLSGKLKVIYPFLVTFIFILGGLVFILICLFRKSISWKTFWPFFLLIGYFGIMHVPFLIQARYTVPVHLFILLLTALIIGNWQIKKNEKTLT